MAPHIMTLGGCFIVCTVYLSSKRFPTGLQTWRLRGLNCWILDSSENSTRLHCARVQVTCFFAKASRFTFIAGVRRGFLAGLHDFKSKSLSKRLLTVLEETSVPVASSAEHIFFEELIGDRTTIHLIRWSSLCVVFHRCPDHFLSEYSPEFLKFMRAVCTAVLLHFRRLSIYRSEYPSFCKITICALLTSGRDAFLPIIMVIPERDKNIIKSYTYCLFDEVMV